MNFERFLKTTSAILLISLAIAGCNDCKNVNCQNGGRCNEGECVCPDGYSGTNCENTPCFVVECDTLNGTLVQDSSTCSCVCDSLFYGPDCSLQDWCLTNGTFCYNGTCDPVTGNCVCDTGYEGDSCQFRGYEKYIGLFWVNETCQTDTGSRFNTYQSSINPGGGGTHVFISNFSELQIQITGHVTSDFLNLPSQNFGLYSLFDGEVFHNDTTGNLAMNYTYEHTLSGEIFTCSATYIRQ